MAKRIGIEDKYSELIVEQLKGNSNKKSAEIVAEHFSSVSKEYLPLDRSALPSFLPAGKPPMVHEYQVNEKLNRLKIRKSTLPMDLP